MEGNFELKKEILDSLVGKLKPVFEEERELEISNSSYNVFEVLKIERKEVGLHSRFIYNLLDPEASHKKSSIFLKLFLKEVLGYQAEQLEDFDVDDYDVQREVDTGNGRVDFIIYDFKNKIAHIIEMKIDAVDQEKQLKRYNGYALKKFGGHYKIYYLTLDEKEASEQSAGEIEYTQVSFKNHIIKWLEEGLKYLENIPAFESSVKQYLDTIKNITNSIGSNDLKNDYLKCLVNDKEVIKYAEALLEQGKILKNKVLDDLNKEICEELRKNFSIEMKLAKRYELDGDFVSVYIKKIGNLRNIRFGISSENGRLYFYIGVCNGISNDIGFNEQILNKEPYISCFNQMKKMRKNPDLPYYHTYFYNLGKDENFILSDVEEYNNLKNIILNYMKEKIDELIKYSDGDE